MWLQNAYRVSNVWSTAHHAIHLQFDISTNAFEIRAVQSLECMVWFAADCTFEEWLIHKKTNS
jgi:hypothetical protein